MWSRTYGAPVGGSGYSLAITPDSGAILVGPTAENPSNMFAIRTNDMGDTVWTRTFQIGAESNIAYSVCTVPEGGFVIAGTKDVPNTSSRMELLRIADDGNLMWNKEIHAYNWGEGRSVIATNHGFLVGGGLNNDACLLKLDPTGTTQWAMLYPSIEGEYSIAYTVQATADGGYVVSGLHDYFEWLMKTDAVGDTIWQHAYNYGWPMAVTQIDNGGFALCTTSYNDLIFLRTDDGGSIPCDQAAIPMYAGGMPTSVSSPSVTSGHLVGMGMPETIQGTGGAFTLECSTVGLAEVGTGLHCLVSPNPANDHCMVLFGSSHFDALEVVTMQGAVVLHRAAEGLSRMEVSLENLAPGPYLLHLIGPVSLTSRLFVAR